MGSPYFVHQQADAIHVVRSMEGFFRILNVVTTSMGLLDPDIHSFEDLDRVMSFLRNDPEWVVLNDLLSAYTTSRENRERRIVFLEARYEWRGWEKFQRVIIFDRTKKLGDIRIPSIGGGSSEREITV